MSRPFRFLGGKMRSKKRVLIAGVVFVLALATSFVAYSATGDRTANPKTGVAPGTPGTGATIKTFTGNGTTIQIWASGNVGSFTSPAGYQHVFAEGYEICHTNPVGGTFVSASDYGATGTGWKAPTTTSTSPLTIRRTSTDNQIQLTQIYKFVGAERALQITMQVKNLTGGTMNTLIVRRLADLDVDSQGSNGYAASNQNVWLSDTRSSVHAIVPENVAQTAGKEAHSMVLRTLSAAGTLNSTVDVSTSLGIGACDQSADDDLGPFTGDGAATSWYVFSGVAAGATKTVKVEYQRS